MQVPPASECVRTLRIRTLCPGQSSGLWRKPPRRCSWVRTRLSESQTRCMCYAKRDDERGISDSSDKLKLKKHHVRQRALANRAEALASPPAKRSPTKPCAFLE